MRRFAATNPSPFSPHCASGGKFFEQHSNCFPRAERFFRYVAARPDERDASREGIHDLDGYHRREGNHDGKDQSRVA